MAKWAKANFNLPPRLRAAADAAEAAQASGAAQRMWTGMGMPPPPPPQPLRPPSWADETCCAALLQPPARLGVRLLSDFVVAPLGTGVHLGRLGFATGGSLRLTWGTLGSNLLKCPRGRMGT